MDEDYLAHVRVMILPLAECVAKVNAGLPEAAPGDIWSGIVPFALQAGTPEPAPGPQPPVPETLSRYHRPQAG